MDQKAIAKELAQVMVDYEPDKIPGGSPDRKAWLRLIIGIQFVLLDMGWDDEPFRNQLEEGEAAEPVDPSERILADLEERDHQFGHGP